MITEIPSPECVGAESPFASEIALVRAKFDSMLTPSESAFKTANVPVRVSGVGFFDFFHGQTGVAPNGIELHPILDLVFDPQPNPLSVSLTLNGKTTTPGSAVRVGINLTNVGPAKNIDLFFVILLPAAAGPSFGCPQGDAVAFQTSAGPFVVTCASASPATSSAWSPNMNVRAGFRTTYPRFLDAMWPAGAYTFAIFATPAGAFADGVIDAGDFLTFSLETVTASP